MDNQSRRNLILAAALLHTKPPGDDVRANCAAVLRHALIAAGLWEDRFEPALHGESGFPLVDAWYSLLIDLTRHEPESECLLQGAGNLVAPAGAHFTACWLTPMGYVAARRYLDENPGLKERLTKKT